MKAYSAMGDDEVELFDSDSRNDCRMWIKGYTAKGDFGGYDRITLVENDSSRVLETFLAPEQTISDDDDAAQFRPGGAFCDQEDALDSDIGDHPFSGRVSAGEY